MEALTALGLVANICQFVDFALKIVSKGNKLHGTANGLLIEHAELYAASLKIVDLNNCLVASARDYTRHGGSPLQGALDQEIPRACKAMNTAATDLLRALDKLRVPSQGGRWASMRQAVKATLGKDGIEALRNNLVVARRRLNTALLSSLWAKMDTALSRYGVEREGTHYPELAPDVRRRTVRSVLGSSDERPHAWQVNLVNKVLEGQWTTRDAMNVELFCDELSSSVARRSERQLQAQIVNQLRFQDLSDRERRITPAAQETFHWIFAGPNHLHVRQWHLFAPWLQSSGKVYWITGKPGSGKSTLMKFLRQESRTRQNLALWSDGLPLVTAHFYFWNSGTRIQMSLEGFYRSIVHAILSKQPQLARSAFPDRWTSSLQFGSDARDWTLEELRQAFQVLVAESGRCYRLCLFIDGLDEFEGDHNMLVEVLFDAVARHDIKLCVASRPWPVFEVGFSTGAHLMLQDLTYPDIVRFTWSRLHNHKGFQRLVATEAEYAGNLTLEIAGKSQGVFLWVDLVIHSILQGLTMADRVADLQRRLEELPGELEDLYLKMFDSIDTFYRENASRYFQIASAASGRLSALAFYFADEATESALKAPVSPLSGPQRLVRYEAINTRLSGCCRGFLEVPNSAPRDQLEGLAGQSSANRKDQAWTSSDEDSGTAEQLGSNLTVEVQARITPDKSEVGAQIAHTDEADQKVTYLHRTAKDFLESHDMRQKILSMCSPEFDPHASILRSYVMLFKSLPVNKIRNETLWSMVHEFLSFAGLAEESTKTLLIKYLDALDATADLIFKSHGICQGDRHWTSTRATLTGTRHHVGFLPLAAEYNLTPYVVFKIHSGIEEFELGNGRPFLHFVIEDYDQYPSLSEKPGTSALPRIAVVKLLLEKGHDPNARFKDSTIWSRVLEEACRVKQDRSLTNHERQIVLEHWAKIVKLFIAHDADPLANRNAASGSKIRDAFVDSLPQVSKALEQQLKKTSRRWSLLGKFITPRNQKLERLELVSTPLPVLNRLESATMPPSKRSEFFRLREGHAENVSDGTPSSVSKDPVGFSADNDPDRLRRERRRQNEYQVHLERDQDRVLPYFNAVDPSPLYQGASLWNVSDHWEQSSDLPLPLSYLSTQIQESERKEEEASPSSFHDHFPQHDLSPSILASLEQLYITRRGRFDLSLIRRIAQENDVDFLAVEHWYRHRKKWRGNRGHQDLCAHSSPPSRTATADTSRTVARRRSDGRIAQRATRSEGQSTIPRAALLTPGASTMPAAVEKVPAVLASYLSGEQDHGTQGAVAGARGESPVRNKSLSNQERIVRRRLGRLSLRQDEDGMIPTHDDSSD